MASAATSTEHSAVSSRRPLASTAADKILEGQRLRDEASTLLKEDKPNKAAVKFKTCFAYTKGLVPVFSELAQFATLTGQQTVIDKDQQAAVQTLELACNEGLATIYLRSGDHARALGYSEKVLLSDPENVKGLFRTGQLHLRLKNIEAAKRCLTRAAKHEPQNVAIRTELRNLSKLAQECGVEVAIDPASTTDAKSAGDRRTHPEDGRTAARSHVQI